MSVSYYSKGGLLNLSRLQSPESHQKVRRLISQGQRESPARVVGAKISKGKC